MKGGSQRLFYGQLSLFLLNNLIMSAPRVLCLGEILFDCLADQAGREVLSVETWTSYPGGAPANVASALAKLGTAAGFIGCVGSDPVGDRLVDLLRTTPVDISGVQRHPQAPTRQVYVTRSAAGDRRFAGFGDYDTTTFADTHLQAEALPEELFAAADFLVLGTLELAYPDSAAAIHRALTLAQRYRVKVWVDVNWRPVFWPNPEVAPQTILPMLSQTNFLKLSQEEALWLFETPNPTAIVHQVPNAVGILVTQGERGCAYDVAGFSGQVPAPQVAVIDTTGAGDAFVAGVIHQLCQRGPAAYQTAASTEATVRYATIVGALTTTQMGAIAAQPTPPDVRVCLDTIRG